MSRFQPIHDRALARHGAESLQAHMPMVKTAAELVATPDDRYLAAMAKRVFAAGFRWKVIQAKWAGFEEAFAGFDVDHVANLDAAGIEALATDTRIVRNRPKIISTVKNAQFVQAIAAEHGGFGRWLADWPADDTIGLWAALKAGGDRLGGDTGAWVLRLVGRDTFRISRDVSAALVEAGVVEKAPTGKRALAKVQAAINAWQAETGLSQGAISMILARSTGDVYGV